jgi:hypothetical protein
MFEAWRVNDTAKIGNISAIATFGAAFSLAGPQGLDGMSLVTHGFVAAVTSSVNIGNINMAKGFFIAGKCVQYPNFVEDAFVSGAIKNPVLAFYQVRSRVYFSDTYTDFCFRFQCISWRRTMFHPRESRQWLKLEGSIETSSLGA